MNHFKVVEELIDCRIGSYISYKRQYFFPLLILSLSLNQSNLAQAAKAIIDGKSVIGENVTVDSNAIVLESSVGAHSIIGEGSQIGPNASIEDHVHLFQNVTIKNSVIKKNSIIGERTTIDGQTVIGELVYVAPDVKIEVGCEIGNGTFILDSVVLRDQTKIPANQIVIKAPTTYELLKLIQDTDIEL